MDHPAPDQNVGSSIPFVAIIATVVALAVIIGGFYTYRTLSGDLARHEIVIATGANKGTYHALGTAVARVLTLIDVVESAEVRSTGGSVETWGLVPNPGDKELVLPQFAINSLALDHIAGIVLDIRIDFLEPFFRDPQDRSERMFPGPLGQIEDRHVVVLGRGRGLGNPFRLVRHPVDRLA